MELRAQKITNPRYLVNVAPEVKSYVEKIESESLNYEALMSYFFNSVQYGNHMKTEFWVVYEKNKVVGFAHWGVKPPPLHVGHVLCDFVYSHNRRREPIDLLVNEFINFGKAQRCTLYEFVTFNKSTFEVINKAFTEKGLSVKDAAHKIFTARKE